MSGPVFLTLAAVAAVLVYAVLCLFWPLVDCRKCKGSPKVRPWWRRSSRSFRRCRTCKGHGEYKRIGRRIFDYWYLRLHDAK